MMSPPCKYKQQHKHMNPRPPLLIHTSIRPTAVGLQYLRAQSSLRHQQHQKQHEEQQHKQNRLRLLIHTIIPSTAGRAQIQRSQRRLQRRRHSKSNQNISKTSSSFSMAEITAQNQEACKAGEPNVVGTGTTNIKHKMDRNSSVTFLCAPVYVR